MGTTAWWAGCGALLVALVRVLPLPAVAAEMDGTAPILCAVRGVMECDRWGMCEPVEPPRASLPPFIRIDVGRSLLLATDGSGRQAPVQTTIKLDARLILQGEEHGRAWSIVIGKRSGEMTATMVDDDGAFVVSGFCTAS